MTTLLLTRPLADSQKLATALHQHGIRSVISPVMQIVPQQVRIEGNGYDGIILTSRHALHAAKGLQAPCFAVGAHTAEAAKNHGLQVAAESENAAALLTHLQKNARYLYLSGEHVHSDFVASGATITRVVVYRGVAAPSLSDEATEALHNGILSGAVFYSARSAEVFCGLASGNTLDITAYCLSNAVANACSKLPWKSVKVSAAPHADAMLQLLTRAK